MKTLFTLLFLCSACFAHTVTLSWQLSESIAPTQSVYRSAGCTGTYVRQAQVSSTTVEWTDNNVRDSKTYCYYIDLTSKGIPVSGPSNVATVTIPSE